MSSESKKPIEAAGHLATTDGGLWANPVVVDRQQAVKPQRDFAPVQRGTECQWCLTQSTDGVGPEVLGNLLLLVIRITNEKLADFTRIFGISGY